MTVFAVEYVYTADAAATQDKTRPAHRAWLSGLADEGQLLTSGPYADGAGALLIFKAAGEAELTELLKQDPYATAGVISGIRTTEWTPVIGLLAPHAS